jgi:hypothetical protein
MMAQRSSVTIVASPRPRVGKTLLARLLLDYHLNEGRAVAGFDLGTGEAGLLAFLPGHAVAAALGDIKAQMALFDRLIADDGLAKVVDLGHESFAAFFALADQIGFAEEARRRAIATAILYMLTPDRTSVQAYADLAARWPQAMLAPVHNEILGPGQHRDKYPVARGAVTVHVPLLAPVLRKFIARTPFSFSDARLASALDIPLDVHIELQRWLRRVYREFRELDLRMLLADVQSSIDISS